MRYVRRLPQTTSACSESGASLPTGMKFFLSRLYGNFALKAKKTPDCRSFFIFKFSGCGRSLLAFRRRRIRQRCGGNAGLFPLAGEQVVNGDVGGVSAVGGEVLRFFGFPVAVFF